MTNRLTPWSEFYICIDRSLSEHVDFHKCLSKETKKISKQLDTHLSKLCSPSVTLLHLKFPGIISLGWPFAESKKQPGPLSVVWVTLESTASLNWQFADQPTKWIAVDKTLQEFLMFSGKNWWWVTSTERQKVIVLFVSEDVLCCHESGTFKVCGFGKPKICFHGCYLFRCVSKNRMSLQSADFQFFREGHYKQRRKQVCEASRRWTNHCSPKLLFCGFFLGFYHILSSNFGE